MFVSSQELAQSLMQSLSSDRYMVAQLGNKHDFFEFIEKNKQEIDCLLLEQDRSFLPLINSLYEYGIMLPTVICLEENKGNSNQEYSTEQLSKIDTDAGGSQALITYLYHPAEVKLQNTQIHEIEILIEEAIAKFVELGPNYQRADQPEAVVSTLDLKAQTFLIQQKERLAEKLKERLGYLSVYYKRNPQYFFRHLPRPEKQDLLEKLRAEYHRIILNYFAGDDNLNQQIDNLVNMAFFADVPVAQIVEIHMDLMDRLSKHLKLEGRSEEVLLDYRLTLIDVLAHLCEMYRRSIPRDS